MSKYILMLEQWNKLTVAGKDSEFLDEFNCLISDGSIPNGEYNNETYYKEQKDKYVNMALWLPSKDDDRFLHAIVKRRKLDDEGSAVGDMNNNPLLDTKSYEVYFVGRTTEVLTTNIIANNLLMKVDEEGHSKILLDEDIKDHRQDFNTIRKEDAFTEKANETK